MLTPRFDIEGSGDRSDIAIARDRQQAEARERAANAVSDSGSYSHEYGDPESVPSLSEIVLDLIKKEKGGRLIYKHQLWMDRDIHEAVNEACVFLGLGDEEFSPSIHDMGHEIEIRLY